MKVLVTGAKGQLGTDVVLQLQERDFEIFGFGPQELGITNQEQVNDVIVSI